MFDKNRPQCIIPLGSVVCLDCDWCPISFLPKVATCSHDILREVPELLGISRGEKLPSFFQMIFIFPFLWCSNLMSFWLVFRNSKILRLGLFLIAFFSLYYILKLGLFGGHGGLEKYQFGCGILKMVCPKNQYVLKGNHCILRIRGAPVRQKLDMILENKVVKK